MCFFVCFLKLCDWRFDVANAFLDHSGFSVCFSSVFVFVLFFRLRQVGFGFVFFFFNFLVVLMVGYLILPPPG